MRGTSGERLHVFIKTNNHFDANCAVIWAIKTSKRESCVFMGQYGNNIVFGTQVCEIYKNIC